MLYYVMIFLEETEKLRWEGNNDYLILFVTYLPTIKLKFDLVSYILRSSSIKDCSIYVFSKLYPPVNDNLLQ